MIFETITKNDISKISHLQPEGWSDIIPEFEFYVKSPFCKAIMKKSGEKIIALGASVLFKETGWIAHIIVDKGFRKQGLGYKITKDLINDFDHKLIPTSILIATKLGRPVYEKLGFKTVSEYVYFNREDNNLSNDPPENIRDYKNEYYSEIIKLDKKITGENREAILKENIQDTKLIIYDNKIQAFYIPGLGEGPIIADNKKAGIELMKLKYSTSDYAVIPAENEAAIQFLTSTGFMKSDKTGTRMLRGNDLNWKPEKIFSRIGGNYG